MGSKSKLFLILITSATLCGGCAVFNRNNTPALNFVEKNLLPSEQPARALSYPLVLPASLVAVSLDMFLLHPVSVLPHAWHDTTDVLWDHFQWDKRYATTSVSLLPRTAGTPLVFAGSFLARSTFDITHKGGHIRPDRGAIAAANTEREEKEAKTATAARQALTEQQWDEALKLADAGLNSRKWQQESAAIKATVLIQRRDFTGLAAIPHKLHLFDYEFCKETFSQLLNGGTPAEKTELLYFLAAHSSTIGSLSTGKDAAAPQPIYDALEKIITGEDRALRMKGIEVAGRYGHDGKAHALLEQVAAENDPVLAVAARRLLK